MLRTVNDPDALDNERIDATSSRLLEAREFLGLPVSTAAAALSLEEAEVVALESGRRAPTAAELQRMSALYRRPVWWLTGGERRPVEFNERLSDQLANLTEQDQEAVIGFAEFLADAGPPTIPKSA